MNRIAQYAILVLCLLAAACSAPIQPELRSVGIRDMRLADNHSDSLLLRVGLRFYNPNPYPLKVWKAEASCSIRDKVVGSLQHDSLLILPPQKETDFPVTISLRTSYLLSGGLDLFLGKGLPYKLSGKAQAGRGHFKWTLPFEQQGVFTRKDLQQLGL